MKLLCSGSACGAGAGCSTGAGVGAGVTAGVGATSGCIPKAVSAALSSAALANTGAPPTLLPSGLVSKLSDFSALGASGKTPVATKAAMSSADFSQ